MMDPASHDLLDTYYQSSPPQSTRARCPERSTIDMVDIDTGQLFLPGCYKLNCPVCVQTQAWRWARAVGLARPDQHVVLTLVGDRWPRILARINAFRRILRRAERSVHEDVFHVEKNRGSTGHHVHMWAWGAHSLDEPAVRDAASRAGLGRQVHVSPRRLEPGAPLSYGLKTVFDAAHPTQLSPAIVDHIAINGGSLGQATRGFWRDASGRPIKGGVRMAMKLARQDQLRGVVRPIARVSA